jgi:hypothetical protein
VQSGYVGWNIEELERALDSSPLAKGMLIRAGSLLNPSMASRSGATSARIVRKMKARR